MDRQAAAASRPRSLTSLVARFAMKIVNGRVAGDWLKNSGTRKADQAVRKVMIATATMAGPSKGRMMDQRMRASFAPSSRAAASIS